MKAMTTPKKSKKDKKLSCYSSTHIHPVYQKRKQSERERIAYMVEMQERINEGCREGRDKGDFNQSERQGIRKLTEEWEQLWEY